MDSFTIELVSNASGELFPYNTLSFFTHFLPEQVNLEGQWGVAISELSYPSMYQNLNGGKFQVFWPETFKIYVNLQSWTWSIHVHHRLCRSHEDAQSREKQPQRNLHNNQCFSQNAKKMYLCLQTIPLVLHSVAPTIVTFLVTMWETNFGYWW